VKGRHVGSLISVRIGSGLRIVTVNRHGIHERKPSRMDEAGIGYMLLVNLEGAKAGGSG
jgi:hypothetical protein